MSLPFVLALGACGCSVILEGAFAGGGIKQRLAGLRVPRYVPPFWGWILIGVLYYLICFFVLHRLFSLPDTVPGRNLAVALAGGMMFINALWNYYFFRSRNLFHAWLIGLPYSLVAVILFAVLLGIDCLAAWSLSPYLIYLLYANAFGYQVWKLNPAREDNE